MIRPATPDDHASLAALLARVPATSMFLRTHLARSGQGPATCDFWVDEGEDGVAGVLGLTTSGYALAQFPNRVPDWPALRDCLRGRRIIGINGDADQVSRALEGLDLVRTPKSLDRIEPLMTLAMNDLLVPAGTSTLRPAQGRDLPRLAEWRAAYLCEIMGFTDAARARELAAGQIAGMIEEDALRVLVDETGLLSQTAFNARLPDMVQIGGVYTPPDLRGQGHARRAVALHLAQAARAGVLQAVLFAASDAARRAYAAIGFRQSGHYHLVMFAAPVVPGTTA